jgi:hypothetical protein
VGRHSQAVCNIVTILGTASHAVDEREGARAELSGLAVESCRGCGLMAFKSGE